MPPHSCVRDAASRITGRRKAERYAAIHDADVGCGRPDRGLPYPGLNRQPGDVPLRQACDFADGHRVHSFQVQKNDLPIDGLECLNQCKQALHGPLFVDNGLAIAGVWHRVKFIQSDQGWCAGPTPADLRNGGVVRDAVDPGPKGAAPIRLIAA